MTEMSGNDYIAQILKQEGVEHLMCFPSNPLISSVAKVGIRPVAFRHERGAIMAADGYSRVSDRQNFGVVAVQSQVRPSVFFARGLCSRRAAAQADPMRR